MLSLYLQDLLPGQKTEVINAGFCASDSFSDIPLVKEILNYQPDLLLVYEGRNEDYQLSFHVGYRAWLVRAHTWLLRHVYLYSFIKNRLSPDNKGFKHAKGIREFLGRKFKYEDKLLHDLFLRNISEILNLAQQKGCAVALLTQVLSPDEIKGGTTVAKINDWLREFALRHRVIIIDIDRAFRDSLIPIDELVIPVSVHPDLKGYVLIAKTICEKLAENDIIAPKNQWRWGSLKENTQYFQKINLTSDFLSDVYSIRLGDFFKEERPDLAQLYYKRGAQYLR